MGDVSLETLTGTAIEPLIDAIARLRIAVFADWPYLYEGDLDYEARYLARYVRAADAVVVAARDGGRVIGASTGMPVNEHDESIRRAVAASALPPEATFYCAESVLLPSYRGQGLGHRFFDEREAHARAGGYRFACFCAVVRPDDHPARPPEARSLEPFWRSRGYAPLGVRAHLAWRDHGEAEESEKPLAFWGRTLGD